MKYKKALKIQIHDIPPEGLELNLDESSEALSAVLDELKEEGVSGSVCFKAKMSRQESVVIIDGELAGHISQSCSRCLEPISWPVEEQFRFYLRSPLVEAAGEEGDAVEPDAEALDYGFLEGPCVNVSVLFQEQIVLALPSQPLCRSDCKGICQGCGVDLNHESCRCAGGVDPRLEVLRLLKMPPDRDPSS